MVADESIHDGWPLLFVLLVTMVKQGSEDFKRHQADEKQNRRLCRVTSLFSSFYRASFARVLKDAMHLSFVNRSLTQVARRR